MSRITKQHFMVLSGVYFRKDLTFLPHYNVRSLWRDNVRRDLYW